MNLRVLAVRLKPAQDLRQSLKLFAAEHHIKAGFVLSGIGSLTQAAIRFADQSKSEILTGRFEIVSLNGTLSVHGIHLHMAIADATGRTIGGHVDNGCLVYTTAEIVIGESEELTFLRTIDSQTGFLELDIKPRSAD